MGHRVMLGCFGGNASCGGKVMGGGGGGGVGVGGGVVVDVGKGVGKGRGVRVEPWV